MASVTTTTSVAVSAGGAGGLVMWVFQCWQAGHIVIPSNETAVMMGTYCIPLVHIWYKILVAMLERWFDIDLNDNGQIGNGHSTEAKAP